MIWVSNPTNPTTKGGHRLTKFMNNNRITCESEKLNFLSSTGFSKAQRTVTHKRETMELGDAYERISGQEKSFRERKRFAKRAQRVKGCASRLEFAKCGDCGHMKLKTGFFCGVRLCPMCAWRRSIRAFQNVKTVCHEACKQRKLRFVFLTLTVRNCKPDEFRQTMDHMMQAWNRLTKYKRVQNAVIGWFRAFEVTRNNDKSSEWYGTLHPHYHVLIAVSPEYFSKKSKYIKQDEWAELWQKALKVDYLPTVDIRAVKPKGKAKDAPNDGNDLVGGLLESTKYVTKSDDVLIRNEYKKVKRGRKTKLVADKQSGINEHETDEVVKVLDKALRARKLHAYGGLLKEIWDKMHDAGELQDVETDSLDIQEKACKCPACSSDMMDVAYLFLRKYGEYVEV